VQRLREEMVARLGALGSPGAPGADARLLVFACERGADATALRGPSTEVMTLTCIGQLPPSFVDFALRDRADGVVVSGCGDCDCEFRSGAAWTRERLLGEREPRLRASVGRDRVAIASAGPGEERQLATQVAAFRASLPRAAQPRRVAAAGANGAGDGHG
jgi:coenzyme F420-reducing hydrogenase delta subunit